MRLLNLFISLFLMVLCGACHKAENHVDFFDKKVYLTEYEQVFSDKDIPMGRISSIEIREGILITQHANDTYTYSLINVEKGELLRRWGAIGDAPFEYHQIGIDFCLSDNRLCFMEYAKSEMITVPLSEILEKGDSAMVEKQVYPYHADFRPNRMAIVNDKTVFLGSFSEGRLGIINANQEIIPVHFDYPFDCGEVFGIHKGNVFQGKIRANEKQNKFVVSTFSSDVFEIYQFTDQDVQRIYVSPCYFPPQVVNKAERFSIDSNNSIGGLLEMSVSEDYICFTYTSRSDAEALSTDYASNEILCYDWNGQKIRKYILPFPITTFCMDKKFIYGVCNKEDESIIYKFSLSV